MAHYRSAYTTLDRVIQQYVLTDEAAFSTTTDATTAITADYLNITAQLKDFIFEVSDDMYNEFLRDFVPFKSTLEVFASDGRWGSSWLTGDGVYVFDLSKFHNRDLLSISSIVLDGTTLSSGDYRLDASDGYPSQRIVFNSTNVTMPTSSSFSTSIQITGVWGYHDNPDDMFVDSGDTVQDNPLTASATSITVADSGNFETYQYLMIEDEYIFIQSINATTDVLTVLRGVNGTSAVEHAQTTAISTYRQTDAVEKEVSRMVIRSYAMKNGIEVVTAGDTIRDITTAKFVLPINPRYVFWSM